MSAEIYLKRFYAFASSLLLLLLPAVIVKAQLGMNPVDTIYGLTVSGQIISMNVNNVGQNTIGSPAASAANANGMGWSIVSKRFYFFNQTGGGATEFVSFDPVTNSKSTLANPSSPIIPTNQKIRSGAVTPSGNGYYTIFPGATTAMGYASTNPAFYYYNIVTNAWTLVSQNFRNSSNTTVANISSLNSGDMAFDAFGNLWMIVSNSANYALYRINQPIPTAANSTIQVDTILSQRATPGGVSFTGIAFNSSGILFMSTGSGVGVNNNRLYKMTNPSSPLVYIGSFTDGYGDDLTSTVFPNAVLPSVWIDFSASDEGDHVKLKWKVNGEKNVRYKVEYSSEGRTWEEIAVVADSHSEEGTQHEYTYKDKRGINKTGYYRIVQVNVDGSRCISDTRMITAKEKSTITLWPNPAIDQLNIGDLNISYPYKVQVFDKLGRLAFATTVDNAGVPIRVGQLKRGWYMLKLSSTRPNEKPVIERFVKN